jgi:hypothetical protein
VRQAAAVAARGVRRVRRHPGPSRLRTALDCVSPAVRCGRSAALATGTGGWWLVLRRYRRRHGLLARSPHSAADGEPWATSACCSRVCAVSGARASLSDCARCLLRRSLIRCG